MNKIKHILKSPILVVGIIVNLLVAASTVRFFLLPYGSGLDFEDWFAGFVVPISLLALVVGGVLWTRTGKKPALIDQIGLLLNMTPFGLALLLLSLAFSLRGLWDNG